MPTVQLVPQLPPVTGEPHVKEWVVPGQATGANNYAYYSARSLITGHTPADSGTLPAFFMDTANAYVQTWQWQQSYAGQNKRAWATFNNGVTTADARTVAYLQFLMAPLDYILAAPTYAIKDIVYEWETDANYTLTGTSPWFRLGIGQVAQVSAAPGCDILIGFASGPMYGTTGEEAWGTLGELRCVIYGTNNAGTLQVLESYSLGVKMNEYHRYLLRVGVTPDGDPFVEWLMDGVVVHQVSGAMVLNLPDNMIPGPTPMCGIGRGATVTDTFQLSWGYARGAIFREYQTQVAPTNF